MVTRSGVRTHADIRPLELKSNALTTRPSWYVKTQLLNDGMLIASRTQWRYSLTSTFLFSFSGQKLEKALLAAYGNERFESLCA